MFSCRRFFVAHLGFLAIATLAGDVAGQDIQYAPDPNAAKNMTLLLKDWAPVPMLHAAKHEVAKAKFYVIDVHNHVNDAAGGHAEPVPPEDVVKAMDAANVKKIVILTGLWGGPAAARAGQDGEAISEPFCRVCPDGLEQNRRSEF